VWPILSVLKYYDFLKMWNEWTWCINFLMFSVITTASALRLLTD